MGECSEGTGPSPNLLRVPPEQQAHIIDGIYKRYQGTSPGDTAHKTEEQTLRGMLTALKQSGQYGTNVLEKLKGIDGSAFNFLCNADVTADGSIEMGKKP